MIPIYFWLLWILNSKTNSKCKESSGSDELNLFIIVFQTRKSVPKLLKLSAYQMVIIKFKYWYHLDSLLQKVKYIFNKTNYLMKKIDNFKHIFGIITKIVDRV